MQEARAVNFPKPLKKVLCFTDIHFGRKQNSEVHNQDCLDFIDWMISVYKDRGDIDAIIFLGDWHEHRSAINGMTLNFSYSGAERLNRLGVPVFVIVGNHDLYLRSSRDYYTTVQFGALENFIVVDNEVVTVNDKFAIFPFMFEHEYPLLKKYSKYPVWFGHFEFKGFVVTGDTKVLDHGPEHTTFKKQRKIFSGHFHKRQAKDNVRYIGNTFPADFSDANDVERGCMVYDLESDVETYYSWPDCPKYAKMKLSEVLEDASCLNSKTRLRCQVDIPLTYDESAAIKEKLLKKYKLREIFLEEAYDVGVDEDGVAKTLEEIDIEDTNLVVKGLLKQIESDKIDTDKLIKIYESI